MKQNHTETQQKINKKLEVDGKPVGNCPPRTHVHSRRWTDNAKT